jgi:hypothetical protein
MKQFRMEPGKKKSQLSAKKDPDETKNYPCQNQVLLQTIERMCLVLS